ncbi:hypothetical protein EON65_08660 [archaeon]|nr:MAG: hypothetical protein EON65_08660 [archaeon]
MLLFIKMMNRINVRQFTEFLISSGEQHVFYQSSLSTSNMAYFDAEKTVHHIVLVVAMEAEADPFLKAFDLQPYQFKEPMFLPCQAYQGKISDDGLVSVIVFGKDRRFGVDSVGTTGGKTTFLCFLYDFVYCFIFAISCFGDVHCDKGVQSRLAVERRYRRGL